MNDSSIRKLVNCASCGAVMQSHDSKCWLCSERADLSSEVNPYEATLVIEPPVEIAAGNNLAVLGLGAALAVVCLGVGIAAPAAGIGLVAFLCPAFIRTAIVSSRAGVAGMTAGKTMYTFFAALGAVTVAGAAAAGAFFVTCCVACFGVVATNADQLFGIGICVGALLGVAVAVFVLYAFWKRRDPRIN